MICFVLVVIAYALGHAGGYRMCKLRFKNLLHNKITTNQKSSNTPYGAAITGVYSSLLHEVTGL